MCGQDEGRHEHRRRHLLAPFPGALDDGVEAGEVAPEMGFAGVGVTGPGAIEEGGDLRRDNREDAGLIEQAKRGRGVTAAEQATNLEVEPLGRYLEQVAASDGAACILRRDVKATGRELDRRNMRMGSSRKRMAGSPMARMMRVSRSWSPPMGRSPQSC